MKTNIKTRRGFTLVELLVVIVIIASLAGLTAPMVIRQRKKADQTEATNNIRQIGFAMLEFDSDYGTYPGASALAQLPAGGIVGTAGTVSNEYFKMFFQAGLTQSEAMFYCKSPSIIKPDGVATTTANTLAAGECGFGYVSSGTQGHSSSGNPARPMIMAPLTLTGSTALFDPNPFDANAVLLRGDNSVTSVKIVRTAGATLGTLVIPTGGSDLFAAGAETVWGADATITINRPVPVGGGGT